MTAKASKTLVSALRRAVGLPTGETGCCTPSLPVDEAPVRPPCCGDVSTPPSSPSGDTRDRDDSEGAAPASRPARRSSRTGHDPVHYSSTLPIVRLPQ